MAVSAGVNVTPWLSVPAPGAVAGAVNAKAPCVLAAPPFSVADAKVCP